MLKSHSLIQNLQILQLSIIVLQLNKYKTKEMKSQSYYFSEVQFIALLYKLNCNKPMDGMIEYPQPSGFPKTNFINLSKAPTLNKQCIVSYFGESLSQYHSTSVGFYKLVNNPLFSSHAEPQQKFMSYVFNPKLGLYSPDSQGLIVNEKPQEEEGKIVIDMDSINDINPSVEEGFVLSIYEDYISRKVVGVPSIAYYIPEWQKK